MYIRLESIFSQYRYVNHKYSFNKVTDEEEDCIKAWSPLPGVLQGDYSVSPNTDQDGSDILKDYRHGDLQKYVCHGMVCNTYFIGVLFMHQFSDNSSNYLSAVVKMCI